MQRLFALMLVALSTLASGACSRAGFGLTPAASEAGADTTVDAPAPDLDAAVSARDADAAAVGDATLDADPFPGFSITSFTSSWTLSGSAAVLWQCTGSAPAGSYYELCVASDPSQVSTPQASCIGPGADPSLADLTCGGTTSSRLGTVYGLPSSAPSYVQLRLVGSGGQTLRQPALRVDPAPLPSKRLVIFEDTLEGMAIYNSAARLITTNTANGSGALEVETPAGAWTEFGVRELVLSSALADLTDTRLANAYVELYIEHTGTGASGSLVWVFFGLGEDWLDFTPPAGYAYADNKPGYQRIQVPLRLFFLRSTGQKMTVAQLRESGRFVIGSRWSSTGRARLDSVAIYY